DWSSDVCSSDLGRFSVEDTQRLAAGGGIILHRGRVTAGEIQVGQRAEARVDPSHRAGVERSHTATHMIHWALRDRLGEHAHQKGSLVEPGRLRFDFQHFEPVGTETLAGLEEEVNRRVLTDDHVNACETTSAQAERLRRASELLRTDPDGVVERLEKLLETSKALEAQISKQKAAGVEDEVKAILGSDDVRPVGLSKLVVLKRDGRSVDELRKLAIT